MLFSTQTAGKIFRIRNSKDFNPDLGSSVGLTKDILGKVQNRCIILKDSGAVGMPRPKHTGFRMIFRNFLTIFFLLNFQFFY
jgi:hypothetical protein